MTIKGYYANSFSFYNNGFIKNRYEFIRDETPISFDCYSPYHIG